MSARISLGHRGIERLARLREHRGAAVDRGDRRAQLVRQEAEERLAQRLALPERRDVAADDRRSTARRPPRPARPGRRSPRSTPSSGRRAGTPPGRGRASSGAGRPSRAAGRGSRRPSRPARPAAAAAASLAIRIEPSGSVTRIPSPSAPMAASSSAACRCSWSAMPGHLPVEAGVVERPPGAVAELLGDRDVVGVVGAVRAAQEDDRAGRPLEDADRHAEAPAHPEPVEPRPSPDRRSNTPDVPSRTTRSTGVSPTRSDTPTSISADVSPSAGSTVPDVPARAVARRARRRCTRRPAAGARCPARRPRISS